MSAGAAFAAILKMSAAAGLAFLAVLALNWLLKRAKAPALLRGALWLAVLFRLLCPVSFSAAWSPMSLLPTMGDAALGALPPAEQLPAEPQQIPSATLFGAARHLPQGERLAEPMLAPVAELSAEPTERAAAVPRLGDVLPYLWLSGAALLLLYSAVSYAALKRRLATAVRLRDNIYTGESVISPFVCGFIQPRIYLPLALSETESAYIIRHEQIHIRRWDHLLKPLWYFACCLHWFNPLAWLAFWQMSRDMEISCDEAVLRGLGPQIKAEYSASLLALASRGTLFAGSPLAVSPLAFGETGVKERVRRVLAYQKPALWLAVLAGVVVIASVVVLLADPRPDAEDTTGVPQEQDNALDTVNEQEAGETKVAMFSLRQNGVESKFIYVNHFSQAEELAWLDALLPVEWTSGDITLSDTLPAEDFLRIVMVRVGQNENLQYFAYEQAGRYYIDQPYQGREEIDKESYEKIFNIYDAAVTLRHPQNSYTDYRHYYSMWRYGNYFTTAQRQFYDYSDEAALAEQIIEQYLLTSASWPALSWEEIYNDDMLLYSLGKSGAGIETFEHYFIYEYEGAAYIQKQDEGRSRLDEALFAQFAALFTEVDVEYAQQMSRESAGMRLSALMLMRQAVQDKGIEPEPLLPPAEWYARQHQWQEGAVAIGEDALVYDAVQGAADFHEGVICLTPKYQMTVEEDGRYNSSGIGYSAEFIISSEGALTVENASIKSISIKFAPEEGMEGYYVAVMSQSEGSGSDGTDMREKMIQLLRQYAAQQGITVK